MSDVMAIEPSTNGRVYHAPDGDQLSLDRDDEKTRAGLGRLLVPAALVITALIVLIRMQRGNYA